MSGPHEQRLLAAVAGADAAAPGRLVEEWKVAARRQDRAAERLDELSPQLADQWGTRVREAARTRVGNLAGQARERAGQRREVAAVVAALAEPLGRAVAVAERLAATPMAARPEDADPTDPGNEHRRRVRAQAGWDRALADREQRAAQVTAEYEEALRQALATLGGSEPGAPSDHPGPGSRGTSLSGTLPGPPGPTGPGPTAPLPTGWTTQSLQTDLPQPVLDLPPSCGPVAGVAGGDHDPIPGPGTPSPSDPGAPPDRCRPEEDRTSLGPATSTNLPDRTATAAALGLGGLLPLAAAGLRRWRGVPTTTTSTGQPRGSAPGRPGAPGTPPAPVRAGARGTGGFVAAPGAMAGGMSGAVSGGGSAGSGRRGRGLRRRGSTGRDPTPHTPDRHHGQGEGAEERLTRWLEGGGTGPGVLDADP